MKKIACIIIALVVLMIVSLASAEEVECQMQWGELTQKYADQLSPEERFIANRMYDALGNTTPEQTEIREALAQADSLEKIQAESVSEQHSYGSEDQVWPQYAAEGRLSGSFRLL